MATIAGTGETDGLGDIPDVDSGLGSVAITAGLGAMSAQVSNNRTFSYSAGTTESHLSFHAYFRNIVVANNTAVSLLVATDGGTATASSDCTSVPPGQVAVLDNLQAFPNANTLGTDQSESIGWTVQQGYTSAITANPMTYVSLIPEAAATGAVTISVQ